jgi:hypothetical protein
VRRLLLALAVVTLGWVASPTAVPVYDGIGAPDEPYKSVGGPRPPAASVSTTVAVNAGSSASLQVRSAEQGPQVLLDLASGAFSATSSRLTVTATPLKGDGTAVPVGTIDGNVYRLSTTPAATLRPDRAQGFLVLRAAVMTRPDPVVVHRVGDGGTWERVKTVRAGQDILSTPFVALGDYAVVRLPGSKPLSQGGGGLSGVRLGALIGGVLVLVVLTVLVLRRSRPEEEG